jgi:hypothetical protein
MSAPNDLFLKLPSADWSQLEDILREFEAAQQSGTEPVIGDYTSRGPE